MPTISQLPPASAVSAADEVPISQGDTARAISVGALLASTQPAIIIDSASLLGRTSLGSGSPEQVGVGLGISLSGATLVADGLDHAAFPMVATLPIGSELVISNQGSPMLMQAALLRGLFSAGQNVAIDPNGIISTTAVGTIAGALNTGSYIGDLQVVTGLAAQDLVGVSHAGSDYAIAYSNFLGGLTIDQAQAAVPAGDSDTLWVAQGSNIMVSQTFGGIWVWMASKLPTYRLPIVEITTNTNLNTTAHNGRILICSQPITLTPLTNSMGSGFQCTVINASGGNITLGAGFMSSTGNLVLTAWQSATLSCATYSGGTIAFAAMPTVASGTSLPGQAGLLSNSGTTASTISVSWQPPSSGGLAAWYIVQFRPTGSTSWSSSPAVNATSYQLTALQAATSYDIAVLAQNAVGIGAASAILTVVTASLAQPTVPSQVSGVTATSISSSAVQVGWLSQTGVGAATSFTVQYRMTGSSTWTSSVAGMTGTGGTISGLLAATSYDFSVIGVNSAGVGPVSAIVTVVTASLGQLTVPSQVTNVTAAPTSSNAVQVGWSSQTGINAATSFTVQYRVSGSSSWTSSVAGMTGTGGTISGLLAATSYDFSVIGVNGVGVGPASAIATALTRTASASVTSITWNLAPTGPYTHANGSIGVNAQVSPAASPIQFGFSLSPTTPPSSWTTAALVNTNLWGAYVPTPTSAGSWYAWAEGLDGSAPTVSSSPFLVQ